MGFQQLQAPAVEPVTIDELKVLGRITTNAEDSLIASLITAAREQAEAYTGRFFVTQKWRMLLDAFPGYIDQRLGGNIVTTPIAIGATSYMAGIRWAIVPAYGTVRSIDALSFISPNGTPITMTSGVDYTVDIVSVPARVCPPFGKFWPISRIQTNAVWLDWTAGYGGPISIGIEAGSKLVTGATFNAADVGKAITIPGAAAASGSPLVAADLVTTIAAVDAEGKATLSAAAATSVASVTVWWGDPVPASICNAIKIKALSLYENREDTSSTNSRENKVFEALLYPYRDLRM